MPKRITVSDYNDFINKITTGDESIKRKLFEEILFAQKERARLRDKSKRQREQKKQSESPTETLSVQSS